MADSGKDQICIVAKVPFVDFSQKFEMERFKYDGKAGYQRVANKMVQGLGRTRRGKPEHYGEGAGIVAIADRNWLRLRKYLRTNFGQLIHGRSSTSEIKEQRPDVASEQNVAHRLVLICGAHIL